MSAAEGGALDRIARTLGAALLVLLAGPAWSRCQDGLRAATPTARFVVHPDGTATDRRTGLTWMRCPLGATLDDGGTPELLDDDHCRPGSLEAPRSTWGAALRAAAQLDASGGFAGSTGWRVSSWKELLSIVETRCASPAINLQVFPDTEGLYLTSTTYAPVKTTVWGLDFQAGMPITVGKTGLAQVRLVR